MYNLIKFFSKKKFVVAIADDKGYVSYVDEKKVIDSISRAIIDQDFISKLNVFFARDRFANISIFFVKDNLNITSEKLSISIGENLENLIKDFRKKNLDDLSFTTSYLLENNLDENYVVIKSISQVIDQDIRLWLEYLITLPNMMNEFYSLSAEENYIDKKEVKPYFNDLGILPSFQYQKLSNKLYNPTISPLIITKKINSYMGLLLSSGIALMLIIFLYFAIDLFVLRKELSSEIYDINHKNLQSIDMLSNLLEIKTKDSSIHNIKCFINNFGYIDNCELLIQSENKKKISDACAENFKNKFKTYSIISIKNGYGDDYCQINLTQNKRKR